MEYLFITRAIFFTFLVVMFITIKKAFVNYKRDKHK